MRVNEERVRERKESERVRRKGEQERCDSVIALFLLLKERGRGRYKGKALDGK